MIQTITFDRQNKPSLEEKTQIINFLHTHLEEYGDPCNQIAKAIDFSLEEYPSFGGFIVVLRDGHNNDIKGAVVINRTGMQEYIPENILVYIAIHRDYRGKGLGASLMNYAITIAKGAIALHVEPHNPAKKLYERLGFTNKYLEMRLQK